MSDARPVGVFDSGIGGVTVLREIQQQYAAESCVYLADSRQAPYGTKPAAFIQTRCERVVDFLVAQRAKTIVVACNSASVVALAALRARYDVPFVGIVPAVKPAAQLTRTGTIGVLTTPTTAESAPLAQLIQQFAYGVTVMTQMCPGLVPLVEQGIVDGPHVDELLRQYLAPLLAAGADVIVLGCTHYPFLQAPIHRICGPAVTLVDPSAAVARQLGRVLAAHHLQGESGGQTTYHTTGEPAVFAHLLASLGGPACGDIRHAELAGE